MTLSISQKSEPAGRGRWKWSVWIDGTSAELKQVTQVRYQLNREHRPPAVVVSNRRTKFRLDSSGKSEFTVRAEVTFSDERKPLRLSQKLHLQRAETEAASSSRSRTPRQSSGRTKGAQGGSTSDLQSSGRDWLAHSSAPAAEGALESTQAPRTHLTFIHGIANKPNAESLLAHWLDALAESGGFDLRQPGIVVSMVYWADVLYAEPAIEAPVAAVESLFAAEDLQGGISPDWQRELSPAEQSFVESLGDRLRTATQQANPELIADETAGSAEERSTLR